LLLAIAATSVRILCVSFLNLHGWF